MINGVLTAVLVLFLTGSETATVVAGGLDQHSFPRVMGMNISGPAYYGTADYQQQLSKPAIVIMGFWAGWSKNKDHVTEGDVVRALKAANPKLLVGQYTIMNEWKLSDEPLNVRRDLSQKLDAEGWWLRDTRGNRKQWTPNFRAWDINITEWAKPDGNGERYPEWLAKKDYETFFKSVPEFDLWYFDLAISRPAVEAADWDGDGRDDSKNDPRIAAAYRRAQVAHWEAARRLHPTALFIGNSDDVSSPEYSGKLQGVFMEAVIGKSYSTERWKGWEGVMTRYRSAMRHTAAPHIVGFNVHGKKDDYQRLRYGLTSCLLDDGYFTYTDEEVGYRSVPWFDEYEADLGMPVESPVMAPGSDGIYRRRFERGMVLVNPGALSKNVAIESGYRRINGQQAPTVNDGTPVTSISLQGKDGIILIKDGVTKRKMGLNLRVE